MQTYDVSSNAITQAMLYGLGEDPEQLVKLLATFARSAAIVTHPQGNRRYGGYVLDIDGPRIYGIAKFRRERVCPDCHGTRTHRHHDGHQWADVPCQACSNKEGSFAA
jgi:hypothetical protein